MSDWLIPALCLMGSVVGFVFLVSMIRRDGTSGRGLYIFMGVALGLVALVYFVADSRQKDAPAAEGQQVAPGTQVRKFSFAAALRFVDQVNKARSEGGNSESS